MDAQRFGKALGVGTRAAAKALLQAADAAAAPNPRGTPAGDAGRKPEPARGTTLPARERGPQVPAPAALRRGAKAFGGAVLAPAVRAGSVLWLEVTGAFFGLFALTAAVELWHLRSALHTPGEIRQHAWFALGMFLVFAWFTTLNFLKAHRRARL